LTNHPCHHLHDLRSAHLYTGKERNKHVLG
jgi:hypothetical protein